MGSKKDPGAGLRQQAREMAERAYQEYDKLRPLTAKELMYDIEIPNLVGQLEAQQLEGTAMEGISTDPALREAQMKALQTLQEVGAEGLDATDRAVLADIQRQSESQAQAQQKAIMQSLAERGILGSGQELAARLGASQAATGRAAQAGLDIAAQQQQARRQALGQAGALAGQMEQAEFGRQAQIASAKDVIDQLNLQQRAGTVATNLANRQRMEELRAGLRTQQAAMPGQAKQQAFQSELAVTGGKAGSLTGQANLLSQHATQMKPQKSGLAAGLGGAASGAAAGSVAGPWGAAIGGAAGLAAGLLSRKDGGTVYKDGGLAGANEGTKGNLKEVYPETETADHIKGEVNPANYDYKIVAQDGAVANEDNIQVPQDESIIPAQQKLNNLQETIYGDQPDVTKTGLLAALQARAMTPRLQDGGFALQRPDMLNNVERDPLLEVARNRNLQLNTDIKQAVPTDYTTETPNVNLEKPDMLKEGAEPAMNNETLGLLAKIVGKAVKPKAEEATPAFRSVDFNIPQNQFKAKAVGPVGQMMRDGGITGEFRDGPNTANDWLEKGIPQDWSDVYSNMPQEARDYIQKQCEYKLNFADGGMAKDEYADGGVADQIASLEKAAEKVQEEMFNLKKMADKGSKTAALALKNKPSELSRIQKQISKLGPIAKKFGKSIPAVAAVLGVGSAMASDDMTKAIPVLNEAEDLGPAANTLAGRLERGERLSPEEMQQLQDENEFACGGTAHKKDYAGGGIEEGDSYVGDRVDAKINSGEMVLNLDQQQRLMELLRGRITPPEMPMERDIVEPADKEETNLHEKNEELEARLSALEKLLTR